MMKSKKVFWYGGFIFSLICLILSLLMMIIFTCTHVSENTPLLIFGVFLFQTLSYDPLLNSVMPLNTKEFNLTDDTGHIWRCTVAFVNCREPYYKIEGEWTNLCSSNRLIARSFIRIGAPDVGANTFFYITLIF